MANEPQPKELETLARVRAYLEGIQGARIEIGRRYVLALGKSRFPIVEYRETLSTPENCPAWQRGEREYVRSMAYAIGPIPSPIRQRKADAIAVHGATLWVAAYRVDVASLPEHVRTSPLTFRNRDGSIPPHVIYSRDPHPGRLDGAPLRTVAGTLEYEPGQYRHVRYQFRDYKGDPQGCCATVRIENVDSTVAELQTQKGFVAVVEIVPVTSPLEIMLAQSRPYPEASEARNR